jgi:hypothetical protein
VLSPGHITKSVFEKVFISKPDPTMDDSDADAADNDCLIEEISSASTVASDSADGPSVFIDAEALFEYDAPVPTPPSESEADRSELPSDDEKIEEKGKEKVDNNTAFPTEGDERDKVRWLLHNTGTERAQVSVVGYCFTYLTTTTHVRTWLERFKSSIRQYNTQHRIRLGSDFVVWLESMAQQYGLANTNFHASLQRTREKVVQFRADVERHRTRIVALVEAKDGRKGCFDCEKTDVRCEFDHIVRSEKIVRVSNLLYRGQWAAAESEALGCNMRCIPCHRKKTLANKEYLGGPRKPPGDEKKEKRRAIQRKANRKRCEKGRQRYHGAKLAAGKCVVCRRVAAPENLHSFDFDHREGEVKLYHISQMHNSSNKTFNEELAKCDLVCAGECHNIRTRTQRQSGFIGDKNRATRKRKQQDNNK